MILEKILERNALYADYLPYDMFGPDMPLLNLSGMQNEDPYQLMKTFQEQGFLFIDHSPEPSYSYKNYTSFDDWLFHNGHYDCVDFANYPDDSLISYVKKGGRTNVIGKMYMTGMMDDDEPYGRYKKLWNNPSAYDGSQLKRYFMPAYTPGEVDEWGWRL